MKRKYEIRIYVKILDLEMIEILKHGRIAPLSINCMLRISEKDQFNDRIQVVF